MPKLLDKLAAKNDKWLYTAYCVCKNKDLAKDLVQDMYIYFYNKNIEVNDFYVKRKIYSLFIDYTRKIKYNLDIGDVNIINHSEPFMPDDNEQRQLDKINNLTFIEKELLNEHILEEKSFRDIDKEYPLINYAYAFRVVKQAKDKLRNG